jgi:hypothetical protein
MQDESKDITEEAYAFALETDLFRLSGSPEDRNRRFKVTGPFCIDSISGAIPA